MSEPVTTHEPAAALPEIRAGAGAANAGAANVSAADLSAADLSAASGEVRLGLGSPDGEGLVTAALIAGALADAERLRAEPAMTGYLAGLDASFERAADEALADPGLLERSIRLRRAARRLVPEPLVPVAKRAAAYADELGRRHPPLLELGREASALAAAMIDEAMALRGPAIAALRRGDEAARRIPALHERARHAVRLAEKASSDARLPLPVRRLAGELVTAARRLAALCS